MKQHGNVKCIKMEKKSEVLVVKKYRNILGGSLLQSPQVLIVIVATGFLSLLNLEQASAYFC